MNADIASHWLAANSLRLCSINLWIEIVISDWLADVSWRRTRRRRVFQSSMTAFTLRSFDALYVLVRQSLRATGWGLILRRSVPRAICRWRWRVVLHSIRLLSMAMVLVVWILRVSVLPSRDKPAVICEGWLATSDAPLCVEIGEEKEDKDCEEECCYYEIAYGKTALLDCQYVVDFRSRNLLVRCSTTSCSHCPNNCHPGLCRRIVASTCGSPYCRCSQEASVLDRLD